MIITLELWQRSVIALGFSLRDLHFEDNLLTPAQQERGEYFFSDSDVPAPRPATILAWASLCSIGPINGFRRATEHIGIFSEVPYEMRESPYVLPFLPKLRLGDDTAASLARNSKAHERDVFDRIRWGSVFVASRGDIIETLPHGVYQANSFLRIGSMSFVDEYEGQYPVPPLYATHDSGYQFGLYQNLPRVRLNLRDPFEALAKSGIPELRFAPEAPQVRRLMCRFLSHPAAATWARKYHEAAKEWTPESQELDMQAMGREIRELRRVNATKSAKKGGKNAELFAQVQAELDASGLASTLGSL